MICLETMHLEKSFFTFFKEAILRINLVFKMKNQNTEALTLLKQYIGLLQFWGGAKSIFLI